MAGVKEKLLDDEDHEALMDPKFIVNFMRSYFDYRFGGPTKAASSLRD